MDEALCAYGAVPGNAASDPRTQVATLLVSDCVNSAFNIAWVYNTLVNQFGNLDALASADWRKWRRTTHSKR